MARNSTDPFRANAVPARIYASGGFPMPRGVIPIAVSLCVMAVATAILWQLKLTTNAHHLVYLYLLPVVLIAVLYTGRLALLSAVIALVCADYFLQDPLYSLYIDNPLQYGDLFW